MWRSRPKWAVRLYRTVSPVFRSAVTLSPAVLVQPQCPVTWHWPDNSHLPHTTLMTSLGSETKQLNYNPYNQQFMNKWTRSWMSECQCTCSTVYIQQRMVHNNCVYYSVSVVRIQQVMPYPRLVGSDPLSVTGEYLSSSLHHSSLTSVLTCNSPTGRFNHVECLHR